MIRLSALAIVVFAATPVAAAQRDELLRVAPQDAAIVVVVQNAREHYRNLAQSPFVAWLPTTSIGKRFLNADELKQLRDSAGMIFRELGTTPETILEDIAGDAIAFAFSPAPADRPTEERAVILIRPRKVETLQKLLDKLNELQTKSGELKAIVPKQHAGAGYSERQKTEGASEFFCFRGDLFAFSTSEADIKGFIDRDKAATPVAEKEPELVARMKRLGVADAAAVILINPRPLDAELKARAAAAKAEEKRFLDRFIEGWTALDTAAVYLSIKDDAELGVSFRFHPGKLPADLKTWLTGAGPFGSAAAIIPKEALFGAAGRVRAIDLIELVSSLAPVEVGKPGLKEGIEQTLGPIVGRNNLPLVLNSLGPDWAIWAEPPAKELYLPTLVAAIQITGDETTREKTEKALVQSLEFGFQTARIAYNAKHTDQIEFREEKDAKTGIVIRSLVNEKGFPPGLRPSFALVKGHLVLATSPDAILRFEPRAAAQPAGGATTVAMLSGTRTREYLVTHGPKLAKFLSEMGTIADEKKTLETLETLATVLELVDTVEVIARPDGNGMQLAIRVKFARPLKK